MIDTPERRRPETVEAPALTFRQMYCSGCGNRLARAVLAPGSVVEDRCHHTVRRPDGSRGTCGVVTRMTPSR